MVVYQVVSGDSIGIFRVGFNSFLGKHSGLNQRVYLGGYTYPIKNTKEIHEGTQKFDAGGEAMESGQRQTI